MTTSLSETPRTAAQPLRIVLLVAALYLGAFWVWSGVAKALLPTAAYAFAAQVVGGGAAAKTVVVVSVVAETALGLVLVLGAIGRRAGIVVSLGLLLAFAGLLGAAKASGGGALACGCYAFFATGASTVDRELWVNGGHAAVLVVILALDAYLRRRSAA